MYSGSLLGSTAEGKILLHTKRFYYTVVGNQLVSWYFEPSQPQRVTSWLKTSFNLSPIYSARKSSNHKSSTNHKIRHDTNLHRTKHTQTSDRLPLFSVLVKRVSVEEKLCCWFRSLCPSTVIVNLKEENNWLEISHNVCHWFTLYFDYLDQNAQHVILCIHKNQQDQLYLHE